MEGMDEAGNHRVVVGVSGSLGSITALHRAAAEARRTDAVLLAVLAWQPPGGEFAYRRSPRPPLPDVWQDRAGQRLLDALDAAFGGLPEGLRLRAMTVRGPAGRALTLVADRPDDVLVVGAGRRGRLRRLLHPSVARHCLHHAVCPVLAVPRSPLHDVLEGVRRRNTWRLPLHAATSQR
ncbi:universal stress protein [Actinacidiphila sp. bgisy167]|uniref:universal stress protein n=1 Tax=Actinacidiphila sp. bgisy167 TaxID=3413797 RepID=UPI003D74FCA2